MSKKGISLLLWVCLSLFVATNALAVNDDDVINKEEGSGKSNDDSVDGQKGLIYLSYSSGMKQRRVG